MRSIWDANSFLDIKNSLFERYVLVPARLLCEWSSGLQNLAFCPTTNHEFILRFNSLNFPTFKQFTRVKKTIWKMIEQNRKFHPHKLPIKTENLFFYEFPKKCDFFGFHLLLCIKKKNWIPLRLHFLIYNNIDWFSHFFRQTIYWFIYFTFFQ